MGSFSVVVMTFPLKPDIDRDVLRAFSGLQVGRPTDTANLSSASAAQLPLPAPHGAAIDENDLTLAYDNLGWPDGFRPWMYDWSWVLDSGYRTAYIDVAKGGSLAWTGHGWLVSFRTTLKTHPDELSYWFGWMGEFTDSDPEYPLLVGYTKYGNERRPWLVWHAGSGSFTFEDLNGPDDLI